MNQAQSTQSNEIAAFLQKSVSIFTHVKESSLEALVKDSRLLRLRTGQAIIKQGEYGESFYVLISGGVSISVTTEDGAVKPLKEMAPGDFFGELAVMGQGLRTATATAKSDDTVVVEVHKIPFQKIIKGEPELKREMDALYSARVIGSFIRRLRYFQGVAEDELRGLISRAKIVAYKKNDLIYGEGLHTDCFYVVKVGNVKLTRAKRAASEALQPEFQQETILTLEGLQRSFQEPAAIKPWEERLQGVVAYYNEGDFFGDVLSSFRPGSAWALGRVEVIRLEGSDVKQIAKKYDAVAQQLSRSDTVDVKQQPPGDESTNKINKEPERNLTLYESMNRLYNEGISQAESALVIYMERCIRCGNCSRSCQARHGVSRMVRRGPTIRRRKKQEDSAKGHELILFPTSCRHCIDPECMIGCPTGAISRDRLGEVFIKDFCIACGNCARRCPYGNISIADGVPIVGQGGKTKRMAVKCDQCRDHAEAACVYNCPRGAIFRVNPNEYFEELRKKKQTS